MRPAAFLGASALTLTLTGAALIASSTPVQAASLVWGSSFDLGLSGPDGNDCAGYFGRGFDNCEVNGSPSIVKFDYEREGVKTTINSLYPSIDGSEWSFDGEGESTGTWNYTTGSGDPSIKYWVAKGGPGFNLFYMIDGDEAAAILCSGDKAFTEECLNQAIPVTSGTWSTPTNDRNRNGKLFGLSHLTFYGDSDNGDNGAKVPEPGLILGLGALVLAGAGSRLRRA